MYATGGFFLVAEFAFQIVADNQETHALVFVAGDCVVEHARIAARIAERKNRLLTDFVFNDDDFVHLQIFGRQLSANNVIVAAIGVVVGWRVTLVRGADIRIGADDLAVRKTEHAFRHNAHCRTVAAGDDVNSKIVRLQVFDNLDHRQIERLAPFEIA